MVLMVFRQSNHLHVIPKGTRQDIFCVTKYMMLQSDVSNAFEIRDVAEWILNGKLGAPNDIESYY